MKTNQELKNTPNLLIVRVGIDGGYGELYRLGKPYASIVWSNGGGWEHVSISPYKLSHTPTWDEMCSLKDMFFYEEETVVQYHPAKSEYVNYMPNCLHLWRPLNATMPTPPSIMVGLKKGQTIAEARDEIKKLETEAPKRLIYKGLSSHDCEAWYSCPYCNKSIGGWSLPGSFATDRGEKMYCPHCKKEVKY